MATINGTALKILVGATLGAAKPVDGLTSNEQSLTRALRDTTNKFSGGWKAQEYGLGEGSFSVTANYDPDASSSTYYRKEDFEAALIAGTKLVVHFCDSTDSGSRVVRATCLVSSVSTSAPMEENATFTVDLSWDGAPTIGTV